MASWIPSGTQIGSYRIDSLLGEGGMAQVYRAWHTGLQRHEALKVLPPHLAHDREFVDRFLQEARTAAGLHHPNIATIHTVSDPTAAQPYFTMQLIEGGDLAELLETRGRLPLEAALPLLKQIAEALDYAHGRGVIHRDIKPANILLESHHLEPHSQAHNQQGHNQGHNNKFRVKLVDFGIAHAQQDGGKTRLTKTGMIVGTPEYMSPEQAEGRADVGARSDLYSLGAVAYEMLCGEPPFRGGPGISAITVIMRHLREQPDPPSSHIPDLAPAVDAAMLKALAKDPASRFESCAAFVETLAASLPVPVLNGGQSATYPESQLRVRRSRAPALVSLCLVFVACSLFAGSVWQKQQTLRRAESQAQQAKDIVDNVAIQIEALVHRAKEHTLTQEEATRVKGELKQQLGDALGLTETAIYLDATNQKAWLERARVYYYLPDRTRAESTLETAMQRFPANNEFRLLKSKLDGRK